MCASNGGPGSMMSIVLKDGYEAQIVMTLYGSSPLQ